LKAEETYLLDESAIKAFLDTTYPRLVVAIAFACGSRAAAEDAVQEALVRAWAKSERGETIESLPAWVTTVAINLSRKTLRRMRAERTLRVRSAVRLDEKIVAPATGVSVDVERALRRLPRRQRETAVLRYVLEMDTNEVARVLGVDEGTVKSHLSRARAKLVRDLGASEEEVTSDAMA
jgi:RNA polymerase sigma-70 factor (ECF subfamily)